MQNHPDGKTILCVATLCPRKNQLRLIEAFKLLPEKLRSTSRLILAGGRGWFDQPIVDAAASTENVQWLDYVSDEEYERLLSTCTVFAYPSLKEGFGIPALDALQRGVPVLTSDRSSLPEVAGSAALYVDPESVESIAQCLEILLTNDMMRGMLAEAGPVQATKFSWKRTVDLFLEVLRNLPDNDN